MFTEQLCPRLESLVCFESPANEPLIFPFSLVAIAKSNSCLQDGIIGCSFPPGNVLVLNVQATCLTAHGTHTTL
jgi:hypothetical protein